MRGAATGWTCFGAIVFVAWALSSPAWSHIEVGEKNLLVQVAEASVVVHARIEESGRPFRSADGKISRPVVRAKVLETLKGGASFDAIVFAQHGHGVADYRAGQEALLFLDRLGSGGELAALAGLPGAPTHVSRQEHDDAYRLTATSRDVLLPAVRDLVRAQALGGASTAREPTGTEDGRTSRRALTRRAVLRLLTSGDVRLGNTVLVGLASSAGGGLLEPSDLPRLLDVVRDGTLSAGYRGALLGTLESAGLVEGAGEWRAFVESAPPGKRAGALRAAGRSDHPEVVAYLVGLLESDDPRVAEEAAIALGRPGRKAAVPALAAALDRADPRLRGAAVRSLSAIGGPSARAVLERAAADHADESTRRRAGAALRSGR